MSANPESLFAAADRHAETLARQRLVLYAGANLPSPEVLAAYAPGLGAMPAMGPSFDKEQPGTELVSHFEVAVRDEACALFGAAWAEPRLPTATLCNLAVFHAYARPGDLLLAPDKAHGGHLSQRRGGTPELAGLACAELPFDAAEYRLDADGAARLVAERLPRLVMLGRSVMLRADDIAPVVAAARAVGATTVFDASHVAGLIAGGTYPNPLAQGVDVLVTSTYKTILGIPHGLILGGDPAQGEALARLLDARFLANYNPALLPPLLRVLLEMRSGAAAYAQRIVANTAALAAACRAGGRWRDRRPVPGHHPAGTDRPAGGHAVPHHARPRAGRDGARRRHLRGAALPCAFIRNVRSGDEPVRPCASPGAACHAHKA
ncbi:glycine hydroxymethyltransferase [Ancylobacter sp.]|uniref:glycine hydroxymethyltransferase n=1 Tax=Ancylobacter sp. TaxID=1872567 RepID=UPI003D141C70